MPSNRRWAEIDENNIVIRVIVYDDDDPNDLLPGTWVETVPEIDPDPADPRWYCGPGYGYSDNLPELFAPAWVQPQLDPLRPELTWDDVAFPKDAIVWHNGRLWKSTLNLNVWEPGVSGWHDSPVTGLPQWIQPTGAHDAYVLNAEVTHKNQNWKSLYPSNVWEPGVFGWVVI